MPRSVPRLASLILGAVLALVLAGCSGGGATPVSGAARAAPVTASSTRCPPPSPSTPGASESHLPVRSLCALPPEAGRVWREISSGARLPYSRDGIVFNNAEHVLPARPRGYYHEYTVPTPGESDRGARRLVTGQRHELYYTGDHYRSFVVVDPSAV